MTGDPVRPKRSWFRRVALSLLVLLLLLGGLLAYLHTSHGFRHVIIPLVASLTKAEVSVRDGFVSMAGTLSIDGLQYRAEKRGIEVEAERVFLSLSLVPVLRRQLPVIRNLELAKTTVTLTESEGERERPRKLSGDDRRSLPNLLPVIIEQARIQEFSLTHLGSSGTMTVRELSLTVDNLQPGQTGTIKLQTNFSHERGSSDFPVSGTLALDLGLEQNPAATMFRWQGSNIVAMDSGLPDSDADHSHHVIFTQTLSGQYESTSENLHLVSSVAAKRGEESLGTTHTEMRVDGEKDGQPMDVRIKIEGLTDDALTMLLMEVSPVQFASGRIDGEILINKMGPLFGMRMDLGGKMLSLRRGASGIGTLPVNVNVAQKGSFDQSTRALSLETLNLTVSDGARHLVTAALQHPVVLSLSDHSSEAGAKFENAAQGEDSPVGVKLTLHSLTTQELRPWLALLGQDALANVTDGELNGTADFTAHDEGQAMDLNGRLSFTKVMVQAERGGGILGPLTIQNETHATLTNFSAFKLAECTTLVSLQTKLVGLVAASGSFQLSKPIKIQSFEGSVTLDGLPLEAMNPLLAARGPARVQQAVLNGTAKVHAGDDQMTWDVKLRGNHVSFRLPDMASPTPPLDVHVEQTGSFDRTLHTLRLESLAIHVLEDRRQVIVGILTKPMELVLAPSEARAGGGVEATPVLLTLEVSQLSVHQIHPWMALSGRSLLTHVRSGEVNGRFQLEVRGAAQQINLDGTMDLGEFQLERRESHAMAAPVTIRSRLRAAVTGFTQVKLDSSAVQVWAGQQSLAALTGSGTVDGKNGTADIKVQVTSANLSETLDRLGFLTLKQRQLLDGGNLKSDNTVTTAGFGQPLLFKTDLQVDNLTVRLDSQHRRVQSLAGQGSFVLNGDRTEIRFDQVGIKVFVNGAPSGILTVTGRWPMGGESAGAAAKAPRQAGELAITAKDWDASMPVSFFNFLPGRQTGPLPVSLQIVIHQNPMLHTLTVQGRETIGPLQPATKGEPADSRTVRVEHEVTRRGNEVHVSSLILSTQRPQGPANRLTMAGTLHLDKRPRIQVRGKAEALDAKWVSDLFTDPSKSQQAEATIAEGVASPMAPAHTGKGFPMDLDMDMEIGSISYRGLKAEHGRLTARGTGGNLHTTLSPTKLAGGTVEAMIDVVMIQSEPVTKWFLRGRNVPIESVLLAFEPEGEPRFIGRASVDTTGGGRGSGDVLKRSLTGVATFDLKNGRFVNSKLLKYIARQTRIDEFEHMGFDTLHGEFEIKDGWIHAKRMHAESTTMVLDASGRVGLDGALDAQVWPRVVAGLAKPIAGACFAPLLHTVDGFTVFPFAVVAKGTVKQPDFGVLVRAEDIVTQNAKVFAGGILKTLEGCGSLPVEGLKDAAKGLFDLLGNDKKN